VRLEVTQSPRPENRRVIGRGLVQRQPQETADRERIGRAPGNAAVAQTGVGIWKGGLQKADDQVGISDFHAIDRDERHLSTRRIAGWLNERQFLVAVAIGMISPGPVVITATLVGYLVAGFWGATVSTIGIFLPSFLLVLIVAPILVRHRAQRGSGLQDRA
jgi:Chromate transporter